MTAKPNSLENIRRVLEHLGLADSLFLECARVEADRIHVWPRNDMLLRYVVLNDWARDPKIAREHYHGTGAISFREHAQPSLQAVMHPAAGDPEYSYWWELDLDKCSPADFALNHAGEVLENAITRSTTDQAEISAMLDERFSADQI